MKNPKTLYRTALLLEYFTIGYNIIEAILSIFFGNAASSIALIGFGFDSIVESLSGLVLIWRLRSNDRIPEEEEQVMEERAKKFISMTFLILGLYILFESINKLANQRNFSANVNRDGYCSIFNNYNTDSRLEEVYSR